MVTLMGITFVTLTELTSPPHKGQIGNAPKHVADATAPISQSRQQHINAMANNWTEKINFGMPYSALTPLSKSNTTISDTPFDPADDYWGLPRSNGFETVAGYCGACHSLAIVMQQNQNEDGWNYLLNWMADKQGMAPPPTEMRTEIISYLTREFGAQ